MKGLADAMCPVDRITPGDGAHYFYGYYDNRAFDPSGRYHLCHKATFYDRIPRAGEPCSLGVIDLEKRSFEPFAQTTAWNFQQGAMLEYLNNTTDDQVIYNTEYDGTYRCVVHNLATGQKSMPGPAVADVSTDGRWGLAINMSRLFDFRPGYGYCSIKDPYYDIRQSGEDGIFLVDLQNGTSRLIISYPQIAELFRDVSPQMAQEKLVINHITFNPGASRFVFLVRNFPRQGERHWTGVATADKQGQNMHIMMEYSPCASHYHWRDDQQFLIYAQSRQSNDVRSMLLYHDLSDRMELLPPDLFTQDIHCLYSPDLAYIAGDAYPDKDGYRQIFLYHAENMKHEQLLRAWSDPIASRDHRCDLHNRWSPDGNKLSFDSTHEGFRGVYVADLALSLDRLR